MEVRVSRHPQALRPGQGQRRHHPDRPRRHHPGHPGRERGRQEHPHEDPVRLPAGRQRRDPARRQGRRPCALRPTPSATASACCTRTRWTSRPCAWSTTCSSARPGGIIPRRAEAAAAVAELAALAWALHRPQGRGRLAHRGRAPAARDAAPAVAGRARAHPRRAHHRHQRRASASSSSPRCAGWPAKGKTVLFVSHKLEEVQELCTRVAVLRQGRLVGEALPPFRVDRLVAMMFEREVIPGERESPAPPARPVSGCTGMSAEHGRIQLRRPRPRGPPRRDHRAGRHGGQRAEPASCAPAPAWSPPPAAACTSTTSTSPARPTTTSRSRASPTCPPPVWRRA